MSEPRQLPLYDNYDAVYKLRAGMSPRTAAALDEWVAQAIGYYWGRDDQGERSIDRTVPSKYTGCFEFGYHAGLIQALYLTQQSSSRPPMRGIFEHWLNRVQRDERLAREVAGAFGQLAAA